MSMSDDERAIKEMSSAMADLLKIFMANAPSTDESGVFTLTDFIDSQAAILLAKFISEKTSSRATKEGLFMNGILFVTRPAKSMRTKNPKSMAAMCRATIILRIVAER